jgi:hypothetical protein
VQLPLDLGFEGHLKEATGCPSGPPQEIISCIILGLVVEGLSKPMAPEFMVDLNEDPLFLYAFLYLVEALNKAA